MSSKSIEIKSEYSTDTEEDSDLEYTTSNSLLQRRKRLLEDKSEDDNLHGKKGRLKSFSRNALNARANRLKKKRYVDNLEKEVLKLRSENGKLKSILDNQHYIVQNLRKEIKYVKSVLANNSDITKLLRAINGSTGMPVTTSINKNCTILNDFHLKNNPSNMSPPDSNYDNMDLLSDDDFLKPLESDLLFSNYDIPLNDDLSMGTSNEDYNYKADSMTTLNEHNYTMSLNELSNDGGICLHVSDGKLSLEFCSKCQENAAETWRDVDNN